MEVDVSLPFLDGGLDVPLGAESVARHGKPHGAHARYDAASVLGMRPEVVLYHRQRRVAPTQMKKHDCHLIVPVWRGGLALPGPGSSGRRHSALYTRAPPRC